MVPALVVGIVVRTFIAQTYVIPSGSMEPTLQPGERVIVRKVGVDAGSIHRGDVLVFDGTDSFVPAEEPRSGPGTIVHAAASLVGLGGDDGRTFVKRVIGLPGERVTCCDAQGRLTIDGKPLDEPYLYPGDVPSEQTFDIEVPEGRLWMMGDHRSDSADSRSHLGDPGGGTVPISRVIGRAALIVWPLGSAGGVTEGTGD